MIGDAPVVRGEQAFELLLAYFGKLLELSCNCSYSLISCGEISGERVKAFNVFEGFGIFTTYRGLKVLFPFIGF